MSAQWGYSRDARDPRRQAEPDRPLRLEESGERAIVDQGAADRIDPARLLQHVGLDQHASSRRGGRRIGRLVDAGKRIQHLEEKDEGRDQAAFRRRLTAQLHHERGERQVLGAGMGDEPAQHTRL